jgi:hypothetical protein
MSVLQSSKKVAPLIEKVCYVKPDKVPSSANTQASSIQVASDGDKLLGQVVLDNSSNPQGKAKKASC